MLAGRHGNFARYELERKFLLVSLPTVLPEHYVDIKDMYFPDSSLRLRIERSVEGEIIARKLTKKDKVEGSGGYKNLMTSLYLEERDLKALGQLEGASLNKRRYILETENHRLTYDVFENELQGLILAEVEFKDEESLKDFKPYDTNWQEVTNDATYSGGYLAQKGWQK